MFSRAEEEAMREETILLGVARAIELLEKTPCNVDIYDPDMFFTQGVEWAIEVLRNAMKEQK